MGSTPVRPRHRRGRLIAAASLAALGPSALAACGSSSHPASSSSAGLGSALSQSCTAVSDVLGNGPDPGSDPIGYALAQPIQLLKIHTADAKLKTAVVDLADAYRRYAATGGTKKSEAAVKAASGRLDAICPGATQS